LHAERAAVAYGVDSRQLVIVLGRRRVVGDQEDMVIGVAAEMAGRTEVVVE
jgi:4-hydroxy 2-oxovalerate aldolase